MFGRRRSQHTPLVVIGLGNPGPAYSGTRHNAGAWLVDELASLLGVTLKRKGQMRTADAALDGRPVLLGVPTTFMNVSGNPVARTVKKANASAEDLVLCYDELDLPLGRVRLKAGGGTAGHRGVESVCTSLRSKDFLRLRIGIGRPEVGEDARHRVLDRFAPEERKVIGEAIERGIEGIRTYLAEGLDAAQHLLHSHR